MSEPLRAPRPDDSNDTPPAAPAGVTAVERNEEQKAISAIMERDAAIKKRIAELEAARERKLKRFGLGGVFAIALVIIAVTLWFGDPPFLRKHHPPGPPASQLHAGARLTMYLLGCRIEEYRRQNGHPPANLAVLGSVPAHVTYERRGEDYYLLRFDGLEPALVYDSEYGNLGQLSGASLQTLGVLAQEKAK